MFDETLKLILTLASRQPPANAPAELARLFGQLAAKSPATPPTDIEEMIWALWTAHAEAPAAAAMNVAIAAIVAKHYDAAARVLDELVEAYPDWAEAWNKRATLHYMLEQDEDSMRDIRQTLILEPRHFGALCGFGQICLRHGRLDAAAASFEAALHINPHLKDVRTLLAALYQRLKPTLH
jgi:tetratricopeptide (TPR) repeat protein